MPVQTVFEPEAKVGDWVLVHAGFVIKRLEADEAEATWAVLGDLARSAERSTHECCTRDDSQRAERTARNGGKGRQEDGVMEVCGTHTMAIFRSGLRSLLPENVNLLSGPGCPVCVTAQSDIDMLIALACDHDVTICTYGDMIRVPGARGSLEQARGDGADVRVVYSSMDAVEIAQKEPAGRSCLRRSVSRRRRRQRPRRWSGPRSLVWKTSASSPATSW